METIKGYKSVVVDTIIFTLEDQLTKTGRHLIKTDTIFRLCQNHIDLFDNVQERTELLEIGMRQVIQSRLYAHGYFSVHTGYFVNISTCNNIWYLKQVVNGKDDVIIDKTAARNRLTKLLSNAGQSEYVPGEDGELLLVDGKTTEEVIDDLEADAI